MGTVFSFDVRGYRDPTAALDDAVTWLHWVDATFSPYRPDSAISRLGRGEMSVADCPPAVGEVLAACRRLAEVSHGYFTLTPSGALDPCGYVKGWAVEAASALLRARGFADHAVSGGGDIRVFGERAASSAWRVGIADPEHPWQVLDVIAARDLAIATSGTAERGAHVVDPTTGRPATDIRSLTVVGADLGLADGYATAAVAMGAAAQDWLDGVAGYEAYCVMADGSRWETPGFARFTAVREQSVAALLHQSRE